jgi:hypothetical protein
MLCAIETATSPQHHIETAISPQHYIEIAMPLELSTRKLDDSLHIISDERVCA